MLPSKKWKDLIRDGFNFLEIGYWDEYNQKCTNFVERWGEPSLDMILHIIQHARGDDRLVAMHILKDLNIPQTIPYLLPFLDSSDLNEQGASAVCLGELRIPQAYPVLKHLVSHGFLSIEWFSNYEFAWLDDLKLVMIQLLGEINDPTVVPLFETILSRMAALEEDHFSPASTMKTWGNLTIWYALQESFVYTLGLYQAFENIPKIALTQHRLHCWMVLAAAGFVQQQTASALISMLFSNRPFRTVIAHTISERYHVPLDDAISYVNLYKKWHVARPVTKETPTDWRLRPRNHL